MNAFPLIRTRWSNERLMTVVFLAAALHMLPGWVANPARLPEFLAVLAVALAVDVTANWARFRKPVCAVSAAVTAAVLEALAGAAPLWGRLLAVAVALTAGKHAWGGTGKNPLNPAMIGLLALNLLFPLRLPPFEPSLLLLPGILLALPFLMFRPYASLGMMAGMAVALATVQGLTLANYAAYGVVFWACLVITDPTTTTSHPAAGAVAGVLAGFLTVALFNGTVAAMALAILAANGVSFAVERWTTTAPGGVRLSFGKAKRIPFSLDATAYTDMAGLDAAEACDSAGLSAAEIIERIERNGVFGMGGAGFPTNRKIRTVIASEAAEKHLIVNAVECDPGLIHDKWLIRKHAQEVADGIGLLMKCIPFRTVTVVVKNAEGLTFPDSIRVASVPDFYPAGAEKVLIRHVLKKALADGAIPAAEGILVLNVQTVFAVWEAVCLDRRADHRFITVADMGGMTGQVVRVKLEDTLQEIAEKAIPHAACVFAGGGIMQARLAGDGETVGESVNFLAAGTFPDYRESPLCSKCGLCANVCPVGLKVYEIAHLIDDGKPELTQRFHAGRCISCGSCSHVCLAGRNLSARIKAAKVALDKKTETTRQFAG